MKTFQAVLSCIGLICAVLPASAAVPREAVTRVQIPAGDLDDAVEALAKQTGVSVMYPGDLLNGRTTAGVDGTLSPSEAFARLLEGTSLTFTEEHGAMRIAQVSSPEPVAIRTAPPADPAPPGAVTSANWAWHEIRISCAHCDWTGEMRNILERLGAAGISVAPRSAAFLSLAPAGDGNAEVASRLGVATHWETVTFDITEWTPGGLSRGERAAWPDNLRTHILPLFTTRNVRESKGLITVDVLVGDTASVASECKRVIQGNQVQRFCGSADQWKDLQAHVGFHCRKDSGAALPTGSRIARSGRREELCASASEWRRVDMARWQARARAHNFSHNDEATASAAQNNPTNVFTPMPLPMPAPTPAPQPN